MESVIAALTLALAGLSSACLLLMVVAVVRLAVADGAHEPLASLLGETEDVH